MFFINFRHKTLIHQTQYLVRIFIYVKRESSSLALIFKPSCCFFTFPPPAWWLKHPPFFFLPLRNLMDLTILSSFQAFTHSLSFAVPAIFLAQIDKISNCPSSLLQLLLYTWLLLPFTFLPFWNNPLSSYFQHLDFPISCFHPGSFKHSPISSIYSIYLHFHTVLKGIFPSSIWIQLNYHWSVLLIMLQGSCFTFEFQRMV